MTSNRLARVALATVGASLALSGVAYAQGSDPAAADALFRKGREAAERGDWAGACPKFAESQRLDPAPGTMLNLADCEEHMGRIASAYDHFKTALETLPTKDDRIPFARQHMAALERKVPHLTLTTPSPLPDHARVLRDDVELGAASFGIALPVDPGTHSIVVVAPGHVDHRVSVALAQGESKALVLEAGEESAEPPKATGSGAETQATAETHGDVKRPVGIALGVAGLVGIGVGAVTGVLVLQKKSIVNDPSHCNPTTHSCDAVGLGAASDGQTLSAVSTATFIAGGVLVAAGVVFYVAGGKDTTKSSLVVAPSTYAGGAGLSLTGRF